MKTKITLIILLITCIGFAQQGINYKAVIKDDLGNVVADTYMNVQFTIHQGSEGGTIVYQGDHGYTTDSNGMVILNIGTDGTPSIGAFNDIDWSLGQHYLQTSITYNGNTINFDAAQFMAVPYALSAANVSGLEKISENNNDGWRLIGADSNFHGDTGQWAIDLSRQQLPAGIGGATNFVSFAAGLNTEASGIYSVAMGNATIANGSNSTVFGAYNVANQNTIFAIGNGSSGFDDPERKNALTLNTGSGNALDFIIGNHQINDDPNTNNDNIKFFFNGQKGAFRTGRVSNEIGTEWNEDNIGFYSAAFGVGTIASTFSSMAVGSYNVDDSEAQFIVGNGLNSSSKSNALTVKKNGVVLAPDLDVSEITDDKALITKEYFDNSITIKVDDLIDAKSDVDGSSIFIGIDSGLNDDASANANVGAGFNALYTNITGENNTAIGNSALYYNTTGDNNTANGKGALYSNISGGDNTAYGSGALYFNTTGEENTANGHNALYSNVSGADNTANGNSALYSNITGVLNTANGYSALYSNTLGSYNTANGHSALFSNIDGNYNTATGRNGLYHNTMGDGNIASGYRALYKNTTGHRNIAIGFGAGEENESGNNNIYIGYQAGRLSSSHEEYKLYINYGKSSKPLIYGEFDTNLIRIHGTFEVNDGNNNNRFEVLENGTIIAPLFNIEQYDSAGDKALLTKEYGDARYLLVGDNGTLDGPLIIQNASDPTSSWRLETRPNGGLSMYRNGAYRGFFSESTGNYSSISDRRTKKDITSLENGTLNKVMQLNPVSYLMKDQTGTNRNLGLISQEVQEIFPSITNYVEESDLITLSYTELIPILIKALQEQQAIIDGQNSKINFQNSKIETFENQMATFSKRLETVEAANN